jgi:nickel-dependent lactate racemase
MKVICNPVPADVSAEGTVAQMVGEALSNPVGTPPIEKKLKPSSKVAILIDDNTRPTPQKEILPVLLERIHAAGVSAEQIDIIIALGTHFNMTEDEISYRVGEDTFKAYRTRNHDPQSGENVKICEFSDGFPVKANPIVTAADVKIGISSVLPHPFNGFGGGPKIVMPGVVDHDAIRYHHSVTMPKGGVVGNTSSNTFHDETARVGRAAGIDLSINCVLNSNEQPIEIIAGDVLEAHKRAIDSFKSAYGVPMQTDADLTITSSYPYDVFPQILKPIGPAFLGTKRGGYVVLVADTPAGIPEFMLDLLDSVRQRDPLQMLAEFAKGDLVIPGGSMDMNIAFPSLVMTMERLNITMVSDHVTPEEAKKLGFCHAPTVQEALDALPAEAKGGKAAIIPYGGVSLPLREKSYF